METTGLEEIGLTRTEAKTYLALLELGQSTTGTILQQSGLNSGKIYEILESLKRKGLASEITRNGKRFFAAAPPAQLEHFLEQKRAALVTEEQHIKRLLPQLNAIHRERRQPKQIVTYSGFRGIMTAAEQALDDTKPSEEILSLGISDVNAWSQTFWNKWEKLRAAKQVTARYILSERGTIYDELKSERGVRVRILPALTPVGLDIYGKDKVLILHYQEPVACTLITDEHTATTFRSYFEVLWALAKPARK
jgi:predicted transcriptional regulator